MRLLITSAACICLLGNSAFAFDDAKVKEAKEAKVKTADVKFSELTLKVPSTWKEEPNPTNMRLATYSTPAVEGDTDRGELSISTFKGGGGPVGANLERWVKQFTGKGKTAKIKKGMAGESVYYLADITGTYNKSVGPMFRGKTKAVPGYRMLGVMLQLKDKGVYFIKLTGPDASIKAQAKLLRQSFGGDAKTETDYEI